MIPRGHVKFGVVEQGCQRFSVQRIGLKSAVSMAPDDWVLWSPQCCLCPDIQIVRDTAPEISEIRSNLGKKNRRYRASISPILT